MSDLAAATAVGKEEALIVAELKAGSEDAFSWLVARYSQPVYSLVYRVLEDPADAADTTQEVFLKVFRGIRKFHADASLKTWIYRIALHEAFNQRRWWRRHRGREMSIEPGVDDLDGSCCQAIGETLADEAKSPLENVYDEELRRRVEVELRSVPEPYRTAVILRDIEELSYEEIAQVLNIRLGTVKSRLMRGRDALRKRLARHLPAFGVELPAAPAENACSDGLFNQEAEALP